MKKRTIISLIVAAGLILSGGVLLMLGFSNLTDREHAETKYLAQKEHTIQEAFESIQIDTGDCDVNFVLYNGTADPKILVREKEKISHSVMVEEGILKIKMLDNRHWTDHIGIFGMGWENMEMTVYLPIEQYDSLQVATDTGDIRIPGVLQAEELVLRSDTGDVWLEGGPVQMLDCMVSTGDITVRGGDAMSMKLCSTTGDLDISGVVAEELHLASDTGKTSVKDTTVQIFTFNGDTGDVKLDGVRARDYLQVFTDTGDITIRGSETEDINIETDTGDICVPAAWKQQEWRIETSTGKIKYE